MTHTHSATARGQITIVGIGPGNEGCITAEAQAALRTATVVVGYKFYFRFVEHLLPPSAVCVSTGMKRERARAEQAFELAEAGQAVVVISSGDAGIYGMAPLVWEMKRERGSSVEVSVVPGISAFQKAAALLGAPIGHDLCLISLSDLMTPWETIERRIRAAAMADFVTAVYNPRSHDRYWQLHRLKEIFLKEGRSGATPVGFVRQAGREDQAVTVTTLEAFNPEEVDMFTVVIVGNSQSYEWQGSMITPRGYYREATNNDSLRLGQEIMTKSFRTIEGELQRKDWPLDHKWALLHAIHTTADFDMENILISDNGAVEHIYNMVAEGRLKTVVTDVTMVVSGIRKGALARLGVEAKCYLADPRVAALADSCGITRTQAGIRLAAEEHPNALFAFGNAPTALMELCALVRQGKAHPSGIIAAPVGFVNVKESKHRVKTLTHIPKLIVEGRKGGSNLAATLVNAILCFPDAAELAPGRDV